MLFNSYAFLLLFLPVTLIGYLLIGKTLGRRAVFGWLVAASLFFYGWWSWFNLLLLLVSLLFNYIAGTWLGKLNKRPPAKLILGLALAFNAAFLGYFKYADFFIANLNSLAGSNWALTHVVLPLGISFYTFQKIAYLVDSFQGKTRGYEFRDFCLFVSFFPQLIAGPITHHSEILPQFRRWDSARVHWDDWSVGLTMFILGLAKKVLLADRLATIASPVFRVASTGAEFGLGEVWLGVLAYTLQLYFDFSGYSDMAIGLARLFGVRLPMNFNSPYKAGNIAEFWRRWHITLSRFLRDYIYIPLGGNRRSPARKYVNLFITMLIGGIWHGAGWTFVIWGALHGTYLLAFHAWRDRKPAPAAPRSGLQSCIAHAATFLAVTVAWVFFRADNLQSATNILVSMTGVHGLSSDLARLHQSNGWLLVTALLLAVWFLPNTNQLLARFAPTLEYVGADATAGPRPLPVSGKLTWTPGRGWAFAIIALTITSILCFSRASEFIYWQF